MNNPPAFPQPIHKHQHDTRPEDFQVTQCGGMTLRDYFAAKAMQFIGKMPRDHESILEDVSLAYNYADAMLKAREQ